MPLETLRTVAGLAPPLRTLFLTTLLFRTGTTAYPFLTPTCWAAEAWTRPGRAWSSPPSGSAPSPRTWPPDGSWGGCTRTS